MSLAAISCPIRWAIKNNRHRCCPGPAATAGDAEVAAWETNQFPPWGEEQQHPLEQEPVLVCKDPASKWLKISSLPPPPPFPAWLPIAQVGLFAAQPQAWLGGQGWRQEARAGRGMRRSEHPALSIQLSLGKDIF